MSDTRVIYDVHGHDNSPRFLVRVLSTLEGQTFEYTTLPLTLIKCTFIHRIEQHGKYAR